MIYIVCDMNCNNLGNYFRVVGLEREIRENKSSYVMGTTFYPKGHCYRAKRIYEPYDMYEYSKAIDILIPEDYVRWQKTRFGDKK